MYKIIFEVPLMVEVSACVCVYRYLQTSKIATAHYDEGKVEGVEQSVEQRASFACL